jgi:hypothetical protein
MRSVLRAIKAISSGSWFSTILVAVVVGMFFVVATQIMEAGVKKGRAQRQPEINALQSANMACEASSSAYRTSLDVQNAMAREIAREGKALRDASAAASRATLSALRESEDLRRRLRASAAQPAADDVPVNVLNREAWEAVRCAHGGC